MQDLLIRRQRVSRDRRNELGLVVLCGRCSIRSTKGNWSNALVGGNVTFPGDDDPRAVASAINGVVHKGWNAPEALNICSTFAARI